MTKCFRLLFVLVSALSVSSCAGGMVGLYEVDGPHLVDEALTEEQIKQAILEGAEIAGWSTEDLGDNYILATYEIRIHTVQVDISYSDSLYSVRYSEPPRDSRRLQSLSGLPPV